jgi:hypothetical protein
MTTTEGAAMPTRFGSRPLAASDTGALLALLGREQRPLGSYERS